MHPWQTATTVHVHVQRIGCAPGWTAVDQQECRRQLARGSGLGVAEGRVEVALDSDPIRGEGQRLGCGDGQLGELGVVPCLAQNGHL